MPVAGTATITKVPDGDISFGNKAGEEFLLSDAPSSYPTGGYPIYSGETVANNPSLASSQNMALWRVDTIQAWAQNLGYIPEFDKVYQKLRFYSLATGAEVANGFDLSGVVFDLCAIGL